MSTQQPDSPQSAPLWQYVPLSQYERPSAPIHDAFRLGFRYLWTKLKERNGSNGHDDELQIQSVPPDLVDEIAPPISWGDAAEELTTTLDHWASGKPDCSSVQVLIGPPGGGSYEIARFWANRAGWPEIPAPTPAQIFDGGSAWLDQCLSSDATPRVLLGLERTFLRHPEGLNLVRRLMESLESTRVRCLIQCDSWGWAYLNKALDLTSSLPEPLVMQALTPDNLRCWFQNISQAPSGNQVREIDSGKLVISFGEDAQAKSPAESGDTNESNFFDYLAWHSRGIPQVAWDIWRYSLTISDENAEEIDLRVRIWPGIGLPAVQSGISQCESFLLHAVLLHGQLPCEVISRLIPFSSHEIVQSLHQLRSAGLMQDHDGFWRVTPLGYPSVRQYLNSEGYLVDSF